MTQIKAAITGIHGWVPEYILNNAELEKMVDTTDEWILTRTGISERHILKGEGKGSSDIGTEAVKGLLEKTNTSPDDIDLLIMATTTPDMLFPASSNIVCDKVGIKNAWSFDLNAACSGFLFALETAAKFVESGQYKKVIVVGADKMSAITDYTDRSTCILFGDAAVFYSVMPVEPFYLNPILRDMACSTPKIIRMVPGGFIFIKLQADQLNHLHTKQLTPGNTIFIRKDNRCLNLQ